MNKLIFRTKNLLYRLFSRFFQDQIEDYFVGEILDSVSYNIDRENTKLLEKISDLYQYPEYKLYSKLISNRAKSLAIRMVKSKSFDEIKHAYLRGQVFDSALVLKMVKFSNKRFQKLGNK